MSKQKAVAAALVRAKEYILAHPDESKMQQSVGSGFSEPTIARARAELVRDNLLPASRKKAPPVDAAEPSGVKIAPDDAPTTKGTLVDALAMQSLADMINDASSEEDDAVTHKRLLKQCLNFAFDTRLHADTRMSASQMWSKLKDQTKARELGPGKPKTREDVVERLSDLQVACGLDVVLAAVELTLTRLGVKSEGQIPAVTNEAPRDPAGTPPTPGSETPVPPHDSPAGPIELA